MTKDNSIVEMAWKILQQGDTILLLSLICLVDGKKAVLWPDPEAADSAILSRPFAETYPSFPRHHHRDIQHVIDVALAERLDCVAA